MKERKADRAERFAALADLVIDVAREVRLRSGVDAPGVPLNQTQSQIMRYVHSHPDCLASEIARASGIKRTNVSAGLQELRTLGYVHVERDGRDGRAVRIRSTPLAEDTVERLRLAWGEKLAHAWGGRGRRDEDVDDAAVTLAALLEGLRASREVS